VLRHLLVPFAEIEVPVVTLCGNHDLYHGPDGYLSALKVLKQPGRFFLIETPNWKIAALDTSFGSRRTFRNDGKLDPEQFRWLKNLFLEEKEKLILMSHHFIISGWDEPAESLSEQLEKLARDKVFAWYWGHEHRCAYYGKGKWGFFGASVGNGAFLEKWSEIVRRATAASWSGGKARCSCPGIRKNYYWPHGFLELELQKDCLKETYHLENCEPKIRNLNRNG
jgi:hypothetical protein